MFFPHDHNCKYSVGSSLEYIVNHSRVNVYTLNRILRIFKSKKEYIKITKQKLLTSLDPSNKDFNALKTADNQT